LTNNKTLGISRDEAERARIMRQRINEILEHDDGGVITAIDGLMSITRAQMARLQLLSEYKYYLDAKCYFVSAKRKGLVEGQYKGNPERARLIRQQINEILERDGGVEMAKDVLEVISPDMVERLELMSEHKHQLDIQSKQVTAKRKGIVIGEQRGQQKIISLLKNGKSLEEIEMIIGVAN
jgi:hypothetical protein